MNKFWIKHDLTKEVVAVCNTYEEGIAKLTELQKPTYSMVYNQSNGPIGLESDVNYDVSEEVYNDFVDSSDNLPF